MQLDRPRFRQDLVAEPIDDAGTRFIDVMDPDSGNVFRFYEVEYSLACAMDGERDVTGIVQWAKEELGVAPSPNEVRNVIATLGELGYLDGAQPAAAPAPVDDFMRPGVVVGQKRAHTPAPGIELGRAGASAPVAAPKPAPAAHVELSPGVTAGRPARDMPRSGGDIALGQPGRSDVSTDLSDQIGVGVEDVKAAVRASQVMKAVDVPPELAAAISDPKPLPRPRNTPPPMPVVKPPPDVKSVVSEPVPFSKAPTAPLSPVGKSMQRSAPQPKAVTAAPAPTTFDKSKAPPAPAQTSRALLVILVIVVLAAIAFLVYRFVVKSSQSPTAEIPPVVHPKPPEPPPPPPVETEKLATTPATTDELKPATTGQIEYLATDGAVKAGSVIATLAGAKPLSTEVGALTKDIDTRVKADLDQAQKDLATATASGNKATIATATSHVADRQKTLDDKQSKLVAKQADLDKLEIKAPADGTIAAKAKVGAHITPSDAILAFTRAAVRTVKFTKADGAVADARVLLVSKADGKKVSCVVTSAAPQAIAIECPADAAPDGTVVSFGGLDPTPPPVVAPSGDLTTGSAAAVPSPAPVRTPPKTSPKATPKSAGSATTPPPPPPDTTPTPPPDQTPAAGSAG